MQSALASASQATHAQKPQIHYERRRPEETVLYRIVQENIETFYEQVSTESSLSLPEFVTKEFDEYLRCGILAHGFLRAKCDDCKHEKLIAFSCKCRGFCPSCGARRMSSTAAHLVEEVIPEVPVRQWVLSLPIPLRYLLASHPKLLSPVLGIVNRAISGWLIKKAGFKRTVAQTGGVTFVQRFGSALNLNIHFDVHGRTNAASAWMRRSGHCLVLDGVYHLSGDQIVFRRVAAPTQEELSQLLERLVKRLLKLLTRRGYLVEDQGQTYLEGEGEESALSNLQAAATSYRIGLGPRRGKKVYALKTVEAEEGEGSERCVQNNGFSLHADVSCEADDRKKLERLCRYVARPAIANERLKLTDCGQVVLKLKTPFRDGTTHIVMSPLELLQRLAALVPRPRLNLIRFHGVLAPNAKWRSQVVPDLCSETEEGMEQSSTEDESFDNKDKKGKKHYISWSRLLRRVFDIEMEKCPNCGGQVKVVAAIEEPGAIKKILTHLGLSPHPPPRAPARYDPYDEADIYSSFN